MSIHYVKTVLVLLFLFLFNIAPDFATTEEEKELVEGIRKWICPSIQLKNKLIEEGFKHIGNINTISEADSERKLFQKGIDLRKGEVKGLEEVSLERLILQYLCFTSVRSFQDNLHRRAMHNRASTQVMLAEKLAKLNEQTEYNKKILPALYQEAWYLFSLASFPESLKNLKELQANKSINFVIGNPELDKKFGNKSIAGNFEKNIDQKSEEIRNTLPIITSTVASRALNGMAELLEKKGFDKKIVEAVCRKTLESIKEGEDQQIRQDLAELKGEILSTPFQLEMEKLEAEANKGTNTDPIIFGRDTFFELTWLFGQFITKIKTTPMLSQDEPKPIIVFIGRSISWLSIMQKHLERKLPKNMQFKHALVSGLRNEPFTKTQGEGYKSYLDSLGFSDLPKNTPILITDVAETGRSLKRYGEEILEALYGFTNIQYLAMMYPGQTINLERARVIYVANRLAEIMFAKHSKNARYCPFSQFYPTQWDQWQTYTQQFTPQAEALQLKKQLEEWLNSSEGQEKTSSIIKYANTI